MFCIKKIYISIILTLVSVKSYILSLALHGRMEQLTVKEQHHPGCS